MSVCESSPVVDVLNELESGRGYVLESELVRMSARELVRLRRQSMPSAVADVIDFELVKRSGCGQLNRDRARARAYFLAEFYVWSARKPTVPAGGHPLHGGRWRPFDPLGMELARAENAAAARVAYRHARRYRSPLVELERRAAGSEGCRSSSQELGRERSLRVEALVREGWES